MENVNSKEYWDDRFSNNWGTQNGPRYTYFHGEVLLRHLPEWLIGEISNRKLSICDWGCAEGDAVNIFTSRFPESKVCGVDFAESAIKNAKAKFPGCNFSCENWITEKPAGKYDVIYSSHTLEHFRTPFQVIEDNLIKRAEKYVVVLVPFAEDPQKMDPEHFFRFIPEVIPQKIAGWDCVFYKVINSLKEHDLWKGIQVLLIFANPKTVSADFTLASMPGEAAWMKMEVQEKQDLCAKLQQDVQVEQTKRNLQNEHAKVILDQNTRLNNMLNAKNQTPDLQKALTEAQNKAHEFQKQLELSEGKRKIQEEHSKVILDQNNRINATFNSQRENLSAKDAKIAELQKSLSEARNKAYDLEKQISLNEGKYQIQAERFRILQEQQKQASAQAENLAGLQKSLAAAQSRILELQKQVETNEDKQKLREEHSKVILDQNAKLNAMVNSQKESAQAREAKIAEIQKTAAAAQSRVLELQKQVETNDDKRKLQEAHTKLILDQNTKLNAMVNSQKESAQTREAKITELQKAFTNASFKINELQHQLSFEKEKHTLYDDRSKQISASLSVQKEELAAKDTVIAKLRKELEEKSLAASDSEKKIAEYKNAADKNLAAVSNADQAIAELRKQLQEKETEVASLNLKVAESQKILAAKENSVVMANARISDLQKTIAAKDTTITAANGKISDLQKTIAAKDTTITAVNVKLFDLQKSSIEKDAALTAANGKISDLQKNVAAKDTAITAANTNIEAGKKNLTAKDAEIATAKKAAASLEKQLADLQKNYAAEQRKVRSLQAENSILKVSREELWQIQTTRSYRAVQKINRVRAKVYSALGMEYPRGKQQVKKEEKKVAASVPPVVKSGPKRLKDLHVGAVMDQFSLSSFKPECDLFTFRTDDWQAKFAEKKPDFVMVESAWNGNDGAWQYKIGTYGGSTRDDLFALLNYCKKESIPTVFWNKEDPPHFDKFKEAAARFDYVFTTDENCIPAYQKECGHNRVYALPFAAQPLLHNPVMTEARSKNICFAGTYYATRFAERREQMDVLFKASEKLGLEIFDRQFGNTGPGYKDYLFPENLRKFIQGRLEYNDMVKAYRRYKIFLNVNSVVNSRTMFSRRVFELLACGTPTVTTPSDGIRHFFGDLVPEITDPVAGYEVMKKIIEDVPYRRRLSAKGVRCVIGKHTYAHRLAEICKTIGLSVAPQWENKIAVVLHNVCDEQATLEMLNLQKEKPALVIGVKADKLVKLLKKAGWNAFNVKKSGEVLDLLKKNPEINAVSFWNGKDAYTAEYLSDAMLALNNYSCDITGMVGVQSYQKGIWTPSGDFSKENFLVDHVFTDTLVFRPGVSRLQEFVESLFAGKEEVSVESGYARTSFEYGLNGAEAKAEAWKEIIL